MKTKTEKGAIKQAKPRENGVRPKINEVLPKSNGIHPKTNGVHIKTNGLHSKTNGNHLKTKNKPVDFTENTLADSALLKTLTKVKNGDFSLRLPEGQSGTQGAIYEVLNEIIDLNERMVFEFEKVGTSIGKQGKLT